MKYNPAHPKPTRKKKRNVRVHTVAEDAHMAAVAELGCWSDRKTLHNWGYSKLGVVLHHTTFFKRNNFMVIPLTPKNHYYRHNDKRTWIDFHGTEQEILCEIYDELDKQGKLCKEAREIWEGLI